MLSFLYDLYVNWNKYVKKRNDFVFTIHHVNKDGLSRRGCTVTDVKHYMSGALRTIKNITRSMVNWKNKFLHSYISKILFIDKERLSKMQISLHVFFMDFVDRFRTTYLENGFLWSCFLKILLIHFRITANLLTNQIIDLNQS